VKRRASGVLVPDDLDQRTKGGVALPKRSRKPKPRGRWLGDLMRMMRMVLLLRNGAMSSKQAVTRRELGLRSRKVRAKNRARMARRETRRLMRARRAPSFR
jgi:hypothetical protein